MVAELLIRPGVNDHQVVADLLAPGGASVSLPTGRPVINRLVLDAHVRYWPKLPLAQVYRT